MENMIISTLQSYPDKKITKDFGLLFVYDDRLKPYEFIEDSMKYSEEKLLKKANKLGANAVLGVQFQYHDSMRVMLIGTGVYLEDE